MGQSRPLYLFIFVLFTFKFNWQIYSLKLKKHRWCAWDSNPGRQDGRRRRIHWAMVAPLKVHICYWLVKRTKIMVSILIQEFTRGHFFASILEVDGRYSFVDLWIWKSEKLNRFCGFVDLKKWKIEQVLWIWKSEILNRSVWNWKCVLQYSSSVWPNQCLQKCALFWNLKNGFFHPTFGPVVDVIKPFWSKSRFPQNYKNELSFFCWLNMH